jgi:hypothetical protein
MLAKDFQPTKAKIYLFFDNSKFSANFFRYFFKKNKLLHNLIHADLTYILQFEKLVYWT